ncbi:ATP-binding protein [Halosquirtibacter xylanolyticus]|uniref:AAA family ATPase n=1 Tax=Halosquirtibacter xylanolyticus TaxID=3374599 RepID=UPI0037480A14|nr:ATP-binding protein [Prolixibacteraceae bacterium]
MYRVVITGPESVGKSTMSKYLAKYFDGVDIPEYARTYVEEHGFDYSYEDVVAIASHQVDQDMALVGEPLKFVFYDSWMIITKIWFEEVYNKVPEFVDQHIQQYAADLYLLLDYDLPWEEDPTRENGGERRAYLYERYKRELKSHGCDFIEISGVGDVRFENGKRAVEKFLKSRSENI